MLIGGPPGRQTQILAEMYGVSSENLTLRDQKNMFDICVLRHQP
jgi:hypothetical protein